MWRFWRSNWILRVHMYLLIWRKTNFFSGISIVSLNQISKLTKLICLHFTGCLKLHKNPYKSRFISNSSHCSTTILSKHITSALTAVKDHAIKYSEAAFSKYLPSIFLHYTHPCRMILSKKKCCLLLNGVSTENQKRTSVLHIRRDFSPTRHMTRINVGLALSLVKLLLSSWKIYMCNLVTWYIIK